MDFNRIRLVVKPRTRNRICKYANAATNNGVPHNSRYSRCRDLLFKSDRLRFVARRIKS